MHAAVTLGRFVFLEARRTGFPLLVVCAVLVGFGLASFLSQLAITESLSLQAAVLAAFFRLSAVFLTATFVITSMVRESNDKGVELLMSLPISRSEYYLGKLGGYVAFGCALAGVFSLVMLIWSPPLSVAAWFLSLMLEVSLVAAISLFFVVTLAQIVPALAATTGLYLLGRVIAAVQSVSTGPLIDEKTLLHRLAGWSIDAVALLLPPLEKATQTAWLLYGVPSIGELALTLGALLLYTVLVGAAGLFDFHRRNL